MGAPKNINYVLTDKKYNDIIIEAFPNKTLLSLEEWPMPYEKLTQNQSKLIIGTKQTLRALKRSEIAEVYIAEDADHRVTQPVIDFAEDLNIPWYAVPSMLELGTACGIEVGTSTVSIKHE